MRSLIFPLCLFIAFFAGFQVAKTPLKKTRTHLDETQSEAPLSVILYAHNHEPWIKRALTSVFEQKYGNYQVILIDDGSTDNTLEVAEEFLQKTSQSANVFVLRNKDHKGFICSTQKIIENFDDNEIVLPFSAKDSLVDSFAFKKLNSVFCDPKIQIAKTRSIAFPLYDSTSHEIDAFRTSSFKKLSPKKLEKAKNLGFALKGKAIKTQDIFFISNKAAEYTY